MNIINTLVLTRNDLKPEHKDLYIGDKISSLHIFNDDTLKLISNNTFEIIIYKEDRKTIFIKI